MAEIRVQPSGGEPIPSRFRVTVAEGGEATIHDVTLSGTDYERLGAGYRSPEELVEACFVFLLDREPKESIMATFDVSVIESYFPEFERTISRRD